LPEGWPVRLRAEDVADLARGAAFLGTGGGGDPYIGRLMAERALARAGGVELVPLSELTDTSFLAAVGNMGAPTILIERLMNGREPVDAVRRLEAHLGRRFDAIIPFEAGGVNSLMPLLIGAETGLPVVDADGMGRAFPEMQMETFSVYGVRGTPAALADDHGNSVVIEAHSDAMAEWIARGVAIRMGGRASVANYPMSGAEAKRVAVPDTMSLASRIGRTIREARAARRDPFADLTAFFAGTHYRHARILFRGKLIDVDRRTEQGFAIGRVRFAASDSEDAMEIVFRNENLIARVNGRVQAIVPDLICVLDADAAEPITTERLRYDQRVVIMAVGVPEIMRSEAALAVFGPAAFGLNEPFVPLDQLASDCPPARGG
jgi:DUF917 family protein